MLEVWDVRRRLSPAGRSFRMIALESVGSTNDVLRRAAELGLPDRTACSAETQTAGRGQHGRTWDDRPTDNLLISVLARPNLALERSYLLAASAAIAIAAALTAATNVLPELKWPNDVLVAGRKVAGVLVETAIAGDRLAHAVIGMGTNLNWHPASVAPDALPATSIAAVLGHPVDRAAYAAALLDNLGARLAQLEREPDAVLAEWRDRLLRDARPVRVVGASPEWTGTPVDVAADGALILDTVGGRRRLEPGAGSVRDLA